MNTDPYWLGWAAGIVDGEGCIQIVKRQGVKGYTYYLTRLSVTNTDPRVTERFKAAFGGSISRQRMMKSTRQKTKYQWMVNATKAERIILLLRPWLLVKAEQADIALAARQYRQYGARSLGPYGGTTDQNALEWLRRELRRLKVIEWPAEQSHQGGPSQGGADAQSRLFS